MMHIWKSPEKYSFQLDDLFVADKPEATENMVLL